MAFWGVEVKAGGTVPFVPPPDAAKLHLSQACLSPKAKPGAKAALRVRVTDGGEQLAVCVLREGATESAGLDLIFDQYTEFSVEGAAAIHLTGYFVPEFEAGSREESEEDDFGPYGGGRVLGFDENGVPILGDDDDSLDDSDYESGSEDEEMDSDSDLHPPRRVVIEDVTVRPESERNKGKAVLALEGANGSAHPAGFSDSDVEASDGEEGSESEGGSEDGFDSEGGSQEGSEEEEQPQPQQQQQQRAGEKRKADQPPAAKQQSAKAAKPAAATPAAAAKRQQQGAAPAAADKQQAEQAKQAPAAKQQQPLKATPGKKRTFPNGFEIEDLKMGRPDGKLAKAGKKVVMKYVGRLASNGKVFDQTRGNATFSFRLGIGEVIKGWDLGVEGMRVGDKRRLTIPPAMAYGSSGVPKSIPPNATLVFEVELADVK